MDTGNELIVVEDEQTLYMGRPIDRDLVIEFADTLMGVHPGAKDVGIMGMRTVAQLALITGANPLPGTNGIHAWKDNKGVHVQFGVGFWRTQAELEGGRLWIYRPRPMDDQEREYYGIVAGQYASICSGALKRDVFSLLRDAREMGIDLSIKEAKQEVGCVGYGIVFPTEYDANGRNKQWKADLRAERDLLRQLVPVMQRARQNSISGKRYHGGEDWSVSDFALGEVQTEIPDDYSADDANAELFGYVIEGQIQQQQSPPPANLRRKLHAVGTDCYGDEWDDKRAAMSAAFHVKSSNEWTVEQANKVIDGMQKIISERVAEQEPLFDSEPTGAYQE